MAAPVPIPDDPVGACVASKSAGQTTQCTKHTKNERLAKAEGRESRTEGQKNVCNLPKSSLESAKPPKATQSHLIANRKPHQSHTKATPKPGSREGVWWHGTPSGGPEVCQNGTLRGCVPWHFTYVAA